MPQVSVIIPVRNAESFLRECLDSVLAQTLSDIEVLVVDDGSADGSRTIIDEFAAADSRVRVLAGRRSRRWGCPESRNRACAGGSTWRSLTQTTCSNRECSSLPVRRADADGADVCVFRACYLDAATGRVTRADNLLKSAMLPPSIPFSYRDIPDHILNFTSPAPWNKLFRRAFVAENGLRFQELVRANDFLFTKLALVKAERITIVDQYLVYYRVGVESSLQAGNDESPLVFHEAQTALKQALVEEGLFDTVERSFVNLVLSNSLYNLHSLRSPESFDLLYGKLRDEYFSEWALMAATRATSSYARQFEQYAKIKSMSPESYLLDELAECRERAKDATAKLRQMRSSTSWKLGSAMTFIPRRLARPPASRRKAE